MKYFGQKRRKRSARDKRNSLLLIALKHFPGSLLKTGIGITLLAAPFLLTIFADLGVKSLSERIALNGLIIVIVPTSILYIITLFRAPKIRRRKEAEAQSELSAVTDSLKALKDREQKEGAEIERLQQVVTSDINERRVKDLKEEERWDLLNERLRVQEETGQLNNDLKEERELARRELASEERVTALKESASDDLAAQQVKDLKEDERWELLNERLRIQDVAVKQNEDKKEGREVERQKKTASVDLAAQQIKDLREDERWDLLNERLRVQDEAVQQNEDDKEDREVARRKVTASVDLAAQQLKDSREDERWELLNERMRVQDQAVQQNEGDKEDREVARQKVTASVDLKAQQVKDLREDERWDLLNERLRAQDEAVQQNEGEKEDREVARQKVTASVDLKAQQLKDIKEDERWELLNETLRARQAEAGKRSEDMKEEREVVREKLASGVLKAQQIKNKMDDERWNTLHERLRIQEERTEERDRDQALRDEELRQMRVDDRLKDKYNTLLARYIRHASAQGLSLEVADGIAPIPEEWLLQQPEIRRDPTLMQSLMSYNER